MTEEEQKALAAKLEADLLRLYGPMITGDDLLRSLGYISKEAFRQSIVRNDVPVPIFEIEGRRGKYALVQDVAAFLAERRFKPFQKTEKKPEGD